MEGLCAVLVSILSGRRFCHSGSILILWALSSYAMMPCLDRNCRNSVNLSVCTWIWSDMSVKSCHSPSLRMAKNFSIVKIFPCLISVKAHLKLTEHMIEA